MALLREKLCVPFTLIGDPVPIAPVVLNAPLARPLASVVLAPRSTLAKRTLRRICGSSGGMATRSKLTVLPRVDAIATIRSAVARSFTTPRKYATSLVIVRPMVTFGKFIGDLFSDALQFQGAGAYQKLVHHADVALLPDDERGFTGREPVHQHFTRADDDRFR